MTVPCPTCGKPVKWGEESPSRPFCSERCRLIDLGEWLRDDEEGSSPH
ncbi:MAG TPA: DNA gyrase inhibitor YacG [Chromatiaceae bacterium]|nr:DNA gyrase inhibitor YacG [Chromatiaceae bacterium]